MSAKKRLAKARKRRHRIARAFERLERGELYIEDVLGDPTHVLNHVDVWDLIRRAHNMGPQGARKTLEGHRLWPHTRVGDLSEEEKHALRDALPPRARRRHARAA